MIIVGIVYVSCFLSRRVAYKDHPDYQKYFKMLKKNVPRPDVEKEMNEKGKDPKVLDTPAAIVRVAYKDHPDYQVFQNAQKNRPRRTSRRR